MPRGANKTIKLSLYLYPNKVKRGKEAGVVYLCNEFGKITRRKKSFDHLSEVGAKVREVVEEAGLPYSFAETRTQVDPASQSGSKPANGLRPAVNPASLANCGEMVTIKFADRATLNRALGFLVVRFAGHVIRTGEVIVPEAALNALQAEKISFTRIGRPTYAQMATIRSHAASSVQRRHNRSPRLARGGSA